MTPPPEWLEEAVDAILAADTVDQLERAAGDLIAAARPGWAVEPVTESLTPYERRELKAAAGFEPRTLPRLVDAQRRRIRASAGVP